MQKAPMSLKLMICWIGLRVQGISYNLKIAPVSLKVVMSPAIETVANCCDRQALFRFAPAL